MEHVYFHKQTGAYFSVQTLNNLRNNTDFSLSHQWFTILILNMMQGKMMIDDYPVNNPVNAAIFLTPGQHFSIEDNTVCQGYAISFNKEFYCIEYHDNEVSCNGLLFVNNYSLVLVSLDEQKLNVYNNTVLEMASELEGDDSLKSEMLKNLLKNLLIRSNRLFRLQHSPGNPDDSSIDFVRKFSELVEKNFKLNKKVEDYAAMMSLAPASLTKKLQKYGIGSPSRIIKNRIITEAKRLLIYTDKTIKEIADLIGYDDQHYFSRLFSAETGISPSEYKKQYLRI